MRVVLDANVLFAAFTASGTCAQVFEDVVARHVLLVTARILDDSTRAMVRKAGASRAEADRAAAAVAAVAEAHEPGPLPEPVCRDPDDDHVLALAVEGRAAVIVAGDRDLLVLREFRGVPILTPRQFLLLAPEDERRD